ncbi:MAG: class I SAM-dependent rRNA methyltransferase [Saprospiraceae bacterium]|nr:class I SAM-dependent rRNA methyltransferase [Lewinella sp.]
MKKIWLKKGKDAAVKRFHPWVFSGAVGQRDDDLQDGDLVEVRSRQDQPLGFGHFQDGNIVVRMLSFSSEEVTPDFWKEKILQAYRYREKLGLTHSEVTDCYRLIHASGDLMPGLIIDIYGRTAVIQCHSIGMHLVRQQLADALLQVYGDHLQVIYDKSQKTLPTEYAAGMTDSYLYGAGNTTIVHEYGHQFVVDCVSGQKTGFFLDQRENRHLLARYAPHKRVLNTFCYSGGFSVYALAAGATQVDSIDISGSAVELTDQNVALNNEQLQSGRHRAIKADVMKYLRDMEEQHDIIILDPPAFAKSKHKRHNAVQAYKRLNALAISKLPPGGILFTFSCSNVVDRPLFRNTVVAAAMECGRQVRVMHELGQPPDHPVNFFHPEGAYLKGLVLYVE